MRLKAWKPPGEMLVQVSVQRLTNLELMSMDDGKSKKCTPRSVEHAWMGESFSLLLFSVPSWPPAYWRYWPTFMWVFFSQFADPHADHFWKHLHRHTQNYALTNF
jgi:hypothetical protein